MIPLSMLLKRKDNTEAAVATDSADCACACDAAPKKQQTLEQHLKQYHHGQMPKGDCSWLKQYKKDHPDWKKDAAKVSKGEAAVDTAKKDAAPKGKDKLKGSSEDVLKRFGVKEEDIPSDVGERVKMVNKLTKFDEYKKGAEERDKKRNVLWSIIEDPESSNADICRAMDILNKLDGEYVNVNHNVEETATDISNLDLETLKQIAN